MDRSFFEGKKAVFLGDSITHGVGASCEENIYHAVLARSLKLGEVKNYGINGSRIAHQELNPNGGAFSLRYESMDDDADIVVVYGGVNDYLHGTAEFGTPADRTVNTFYGALHVLFSGLMRKYTDKTLIVMTPMHCLRENDPQDPRNAVTGKLLSDYVAAIREVAEYYSMPLLDLYKLSGIRPSVEENRAHFLPDGLHPCDAGNKRIAERLEGFLLSL